MNGSHAKANSNFAEYC